MPIPVDQTVDAKLRPLGVQNVALLAPRISHSLLFHLIELVEARGERILEVLHVPFRMQRLPRTGACLALARLEHEKQGVQPGNDLRYRQAQKGYTLSLQMRRGGGTKKVVELVRIRLQGEDS